MEILKMNQHFSLRCQIEMNYISKATKNQNIMKLVKNRSISTSDRSSVVKTEKTVIATLKL